MKAYYKKKPQTLKKWHQQRKKDIRNLVINAKNKPCVDCKQSYPYYVMDLDHIKGTKKFLLSIAASNHRSLKSVIEEIAKCEAVCANCHRIRTFKNIPEHSVLASEHRL